MNFQICNTWDSNGIDHQAIKLNVTRCKTGLQLSVDAQFFHDPPPMGPPGEPFQELWEYEVVEAFFLNDKDQYLEVELSPHGQHLVLLLNGCRNCIKDQLPLKYTSEINGDKWEGTAVIPYQYFPSNVMKFNAFAIHGTGSLRIYEALFPVPRGKYSQPDFHRLEYFNEIDFKELIPDNIGSEQPSSEWT